MNMMMMRPAAACSMDNPESQTEGGGTRMLIPLRSMVEDDSGVRIMITGIRGVDEEELGTSWVSSCNAIQDSNIMVPVHSS